MEPANRSFSIVKQSSGFSLMEMAVVLMIMGVLMSGVLVSVSQTTLNARRSTALAQLRSVEEALYGFAESQGRLPCPASNTTDGGEDGVGTPIVCNISHGFVPSATLGINGQINADGLLLDPWGNPIRYSVVRTALNDNAGNTNPGNPDFSNRTSIDNFFGNGTAIDPTNMLQVCDESTCMNNVLTDISPAVILTTGENGAAYSAGTSSNNEVANGGDAALGAYAINDDLIFVSANYIEDQFDDQLVWLSPYVLFNRMVSAGKLP